MSATVRALIDVSGARAFAVPGRVPGTAGVEGMLIEGPQGWGEFSPRCEAEASRAFVAATEAGTVGWPDPVRGRIPVAATVGTADPAVAGEIVAATGVRTLRVPIGARPHTDGQDRARLRAARSALGDAGCLRPVLEPGWDTAAGLAALGQVYVNDAFSAAHRAHASTEGIARLMPSCAGRLMEAELKALNAALGDPERPVVAVVGGAKVSTKLDLLGNLVSKVNYLVIGGGMANTFLVAKGIQVGKSLAEHDMADTAREILAKADEVGCEIHLPVDVVVAREFKAGAASEVVAADACPPDAMILDAGPLSVAEVGKVFEASRTLIWNGPLGAFEIEPFDRATNAAAAKAAELTRAGRLVSVAGGGDTVAALWDLVWQGRITNDSFAALRALHKGGRALGQTELGREGRRSSFLGAQGFRSRRTTPRLCASASA